ncbi:MAG TPA: C45 family peptidase [Terriglobales bacterium]|nr:C45 family peptidase [Terriglobales bacterium]
MKSLFLPVFAFFLTIAAGAALFLPLQASSADPRLRGAYRFEQNGWIYVHLQGTPEQLGYQHGYLLAPEIADAMEVYKLRATHDTGRDWAFFKQNAHDMLWPRIDPEYQQELQGIVSGLQARGVKLDLDEVVALNAMEEVPDYYVPWLNSQQKSENAPRLAAPGNCSALIATGSYTRDGRIVIAHSNWTSYLQGQRWTVIFDIVPQKGERILMDGYPGIITSDDDFGVNGAGIVVTETTITQFHGFDPKGTPEFARSRKAMQYAKSIDDWIAIMRDGNNGGYANDWLVGDNKTGEIAQVELGLKHTPVWRTRDGYFHGSNWARDPKVIAEETSFDAKDPASSPNARKTRWEQLIEQAKGKIDVAFAQQALADHYDVIEKKQQANERTLCGHADASSRGIPEWIWGPNYPGGAVQGKAMDSAMASSLSFYARAGHPCGADFHAKEFLARYPAYSWQAPRLQDMKAGPWTLFKAGQQR